MKWIGFIALVLGLGWSFYSCWVFYIGQRSVHEFEEQLKAQVTERLKMLASVSVLLDRRR